MGLHRVVSFLLAVAFALAVMGITVPAGQRSAVDAREDFPCRHHVCGCLTAEMCRSHCCCFKPIQAKRCCTAPEASFAKAEDDPISLRTDTIGDTDGPQTEAADSAGRRVVLLLSSLQCNGGKSLWLALRMVIQAGDQAAPLPEPDPAGRLVVPTSRWMAQSSSEPETPPPRA